MLWDGNVLIVSSERVVKATQTGLFSRIVKEIGTTDAAVDSSWTKRGLFGFLWNAGTITLGSGHAIEAKELPHPHEVFNLIQTISQQARKDIHESRMLRDSRMDRIQSSLQSLDDTHLKQVEHILRGEAPAIRQQAFDELHVLHKEIPAADPPSPSDALGLRGAGERKEVEHDPHQEYPVEHHHKTLPIDQDEDLASAPFQSYPVHHNYNPENSDNNPVNLGL